jgi:hypothetical protein
MRVGVRGNSLATAVVLLKKSGGNEVKPTPKEFNMNNPQ